MDRLPSAIAAIALAFPLSSTAQTIETASPKVDAHSEASAIYTVFLNKWLGRGSSITNVAQFVEPPSGDELRSYSDCLTGSKLVLPDVAVAAKFDLTDTDIRKRTDIRLVDPSQWHPRDPGDSIAHGTSVPRAVAQGFAGGLLTLSAIVFDETNKTAIFGYSFVCGRLCGSGSIVVFTRTSTGWAQSKRECGGWIS
jgi:hypothetical protein